MTDDSNVKEKKKPCRCLEKGLTPCSERKNRMSNEEMLFDLKKQRSELVQQHENGDKSVESSIQFIDNILSQFDVSQ